MQPSRQEEKHSPIEEEWKIVFALRLPPRKQTPLHTRIRVRIKLNVRRDSFAVCPGKQSSAILLSVRRIYSCGQSEEQIATLAAF